MHTFGLTSPDGRLRTTNTGIQGASLRGLQNSQRAESGHPHCLQGALERSCHEAWGCEVVYLVRLGGFDRAVDRCLVLQVALDEVDLVPA